MSSENSTANSCFGNTIYSQTEQATQTTELEDEEEITVSTSPTLPLPKDLNGYDAVTVYGFKKRSQDTVTPHSNIIKTDEVVGAAKKLSNIEALSNRYQYCKDVIAPFLTYADQSFTPVLKGRVDDSQQDCTYSKKLIHGFGVKEESQVTYHSNPITPTIEKQASLNMDNAGGASPSKQADTEEKTYKPHKKPCKVEKETKICYKHFETGQRRNVCPPKEEKKCKPKSNNESQNIATPSMNINETDSILPQQPSIDEIIDNHIHTVSTIKLAMDDFMNKVCESSKEAIAMIACESVKQLEKLKKTDAVIKCCDHKCRADTLQLIQDVHSPKDANLNMRDDISQALENFVTTVDSTFSGFSNVISKNNETLPSLKSPSIIEKLTIQQKLPHHIFTPVTGTTTGYPSNVFSAIKSRIFSIFTDDGNPPALTMSQRSHEVSVKNSHDGSGIKGTSTSTNERTDNSSTTG